MYSMWCREHHTPFAGTSGNFPECNLFIAYEKVSNFDIKPLLFFMLRYHCMLNPNQSDDVDYLTITASLTVDLAARLTLMQYGNISTVKTVNLVYLAFFVSSVSDL